MYYLSRSTPDYSLGFNTFRDFDRLFSRVFDDVSYSVSRHFDLDETDDAYHLSLDLPGFKQDNVDVSLENNVLSVTAKKGERSYQQSVTVPSGVDVEKIEARLEDGVLCIILGKKALAKPRKIAIK